MHETIVGNALVEECRNRERISSDTWEAGSLPPRTFLARLYLLLGNSLTTLVTAVTPACARTRSNGNSMVKRR